MFRYIHKNISSMFLALLAEILRVCKLSFIVGSKTLFFTATQCCSPLLGKYGGLSTSVLYYAARTLFTLIMYGSVSAFMLLYHIPTLFASAYMASIRRYRKITVFIPVVSFILFLVHPVGMHGLIYTSLWFIPLVYSLLRTHTIFFECLSTTLIAHAVGSVIWLYTRDTTPQFWIHLLPLACAERLFFASGMTVIIKVLQGLKMFALTGRKVAS